ncbi:OB-fold domain-containing protein [soil metagenome]
MPTKTRVPAVEGWFTDGPDGPALLGTRCRACATYFFPRQATFCRNPACRSTEFDDVPLSRTGTIWSFTDARYQPPPPYVAADPYEPFALAAVELADEQLVVLGQMVAGVGVGDLHAGMEVELVLDTLYTDDDHEYTVWKWRPVDGAAGR